MCGIFGIVANNTISIEKDKFKEIVKFLFLASESRGKDASGLAIQIENEINILKRALPASKFVKTKEYQEVMYEVDIKKIVLIGHSRMETNGSFATNYNNQPIIKDGIVTIHNGIVVNDLDLWRLHPDIKRVFEVDTEIINSLSRKYLNQGFNLSKSLKKVFQQVEGSYSVAMFFEDLPYLVLATNTGSLYTAENKKVGFFVFASERRILDELIKKYFKKDSKKILIKQLKISDNYIIKLPFINNRRIKEIQIGRDEAINTTFIFNKKCQLTELTTVIGNEYKKNIYKISKLKRCTKCILPETMPFITFNESGICNYCSNYISNKVLGMDCLKSIIKPVYVPKNRNCIVAFSGGRDSSFVLHYVKNVLKLNPIAFSYDWGMLTNIGRRNQARMIGKLGVEHILHAANIQQKRENIKQNVLAWLKNPNLGTVPLFMAGDKQYFYYVNRLKKEFNTNIVIMGENQLERTDFKNGFAGVKQEQKGYMAYNVSSINKIKILFFYASEFLKNTAFINSSLIDSVMAFFSFFSTSHDYINLFSYIQWNELLINNLLIKTYNWELADDTYDTWRIGDGTAAFYNYIYYTIAGFTENDTFRSNQIRNNQISRIEALNLVADSNRPRTNSIIWYCNTIQIDPIQTIKAINKISKLYE